jgi:hypothetical protein
MTKFNTTAIRNLLIETFPDEEEFGFFCDENFPDVQGKFPEGASLRTKAQTLMQHCLQSGSLAELLKLIQINYPDKYQTRSASLYLPDASPTSFAPTSVRPPEAKAIEPTPAPASTEAAPEPAPVTPSPPVVVNGGRPSVFISYSRIDSAFVRQLHQELINRGISAWFDKEDIGVADHWRTSIVEGIRDCKVFVLALSPDSTASENVRKEVDLAERYKKRIVPLMWRTTEIPVGMEYQLAGIQWIDFKETASQKNFNELADVLQRLIGGASLTEATKDKQIAKESTIPPVAKEEPTSGGLVLTLGTKKIVNPIAIGASVTSSVVTQFGLNTASQDAVDLELKWLFSAADNFLKVRKNEIKRSQPIEVDIPPTAQPPQGSNQLLSSLNDFDLQIWEGQLESMLTRIRTYLRNLDILLDRLANMGDAGKGDVYLQNQIRGGRIDIVKILQDMAKLINDAYGIRVTSPSQLLQMLEQQ